jgi:hypothetical protein
VRFAGKAPVKVTGELMDARAERSGRSSPAGEEVSPIGAKAGQVRDGGPLAGDAGRFAPADIDAPGAGAMSRRGLEADIKGTKARAST